MQDAARWLVVAVTFSSLFAVAGCKEEKKVDEIDAALQIATAYCEQLYDCTCADSAGFNSKEACFAAVNSQLGEQQADAVRNALFYDAGCVADAIDDVHAFGCSRDPDDVPTCRSCFAYYGAIAENERCLRYGAFSTCQQGLVCVPRQTYDGDVIDVCSPACERVGANEPCAFQGPDYQILHACDEGLVCDSEASGFCLPLPAPGSPCASGGVCGVEAWCDVTTDPPICASMKGLDEGCESDIECASTWCRLGTRCAAPLANGSPCVTTMDRCDVGLACPSDYPFCIPTDALVCQLPPVTL